jgi:hypothetical protein
MMNVFYLVKLFPKKKNKLIFFYISIDAVPIIREFLRSIYTKHSTAFVQVMQTLNEPLRIIVTKHLQTN